MLNTIPKKRAQVILPILFLLLLMTATSANAASKFIKADKGGVIRIDWWAYLKIEPDGLSQDTRVTADLEWTDDQINLQIEAPGATLCKPAKLMISWWAIYDFVDSFILYGDDGSEIKPFINWWGLNYYMSHFSLYYFRRR